MPERTLSCTSDELRLFVPIEDLDDITRHALTRWLWEHGITPSALQIGRPILRDGLHRVLAWYEQQPDGTTQRRWRYHPSLEGAWPAPFPMAVHHQNTLTSTPIECLEA